MITSSIVNQVLTQLILIHTMTDKFIPIKAVPSNLVPTEWDSNNAEPSFLPGKALRDRLHRPLQDLRISVTDRCNFRCTYCMPKEIFDQNYQYLPQADLLSFEEITRIAQLFVARGVTKIRLTGGEPLLRKNLEDLIKMLSKLRTLDNQALDLALTTNGSLLTRKAQSLKDAGLSRLTVSLDALDDRVFKKMNDVDYPVAQVLEGIEAAQAAGFERIKINMVVKKSSNRDQIVPMARYFKNSPHILRFIEFMDVGSSNQWCMDEVLTSEQILSDLAQAGMPLIKLKANSASETASRYQHRDEQGELGFISSVSQAFCHECSRARLSTQGMLYTCLFASQGYDLRHFLRHPSKDKADTELAHFVTNIWQHRQDRYSELRSNESEKMPSTSQKIEMSYIGG